ncbi:Protein of unknown function [Deinococcus reticulitermitis]|uniref:DUF3995 domain-containing protein n=1 Tax=Deinococcus reticulitermitis TaxID=856736 RepID=A0A1H6S177_9DEIO|nr:DUF3995 domain-containing protein [Deinococcus reticulitermitis]SEI57505.1 Protein of unknown function [Deinococcus reticulitermitis]
MLRQAQRPVQLACLLGLVHAAFSLSWALGGRWLVETVGQGPQDLLAASPLGAGPVLGLIAVFKAAAALIPVLNAGGRMPWPRLWRAVSWVGGSFLVLYGGVNSLAALAVLAGVIQVQSPDRAGLIGHALLWDPLFFFWGLFLVQHLWLTRRPRS